LLGTLSRRRRNPQSGFRGNLELEDNRYDNDIEFKDDSVSTYRVASL